MKIIRTRGSLQKWRKDLSSRASLGFVPTMGALHEGHLSLIRKARAENSKLVVSIFVNPTQFGQVKDFATYPRTQKQDVELLKKEKVDLLFYPRSDKELYPLGSDVKVMPRKNITDVLEGVQRPGHFEGVATVVTKLFMLIQPTTAYFGEKDYQQLKMIEALVKDLFIPVKIKACRTVREKSGLAMSSRNARLLEEDRMAAAKLYSVLRKHEDLEEAQSKLSKLGFGIEYLKDWDSRRLAAVQFRGVRLIDNIRKKSVKKGPA